MTQRDAQERLSYIGAMFVIILSLLFIGISLHLWRSSSKIIPPKIELPKEPPDLDLLITANRQGKLEVCGCPGKRAEDLSKVATLIQEAANKMKRKGTLVSIIEGGDFVGGADVVPYLLKAYRLIGYQCITLSPRDQKRLSAIQTNSDGIQLLLPADDKSLQNFQIKGEKFRLILVNLGQPPTKDENYWRQILPKLQALKQNNTLLAVVAHVSQKDAVQLIPRLKGISNILLIDDTIASSFAASTTLVADGELFTSKAGKEVSGIFVASLPQSRSSVLSLMIWASSEKGKSYRFDAQWLQSIGHSDHEQVKKIVDEYYENRQKQLEREMKQLIKIALQKSYLPPEFCGKCHQSQYDQWLSTKHAHAIETLEKQKRLDKNCLTCHSLEFRMRAIVTEKKKRGVECVDCHIDLQDPATAQMHGQRPGERSTTKTVNETVCTRCHDQQNSPNFNLQTYLPKVTH